MATYTRGELGPWLTKNPRRFHAAGAARTHVLLGGVLASTPFTPPITSLPGWCLVTGDGQAMPVPFVFTFTLIAGPGFFVHFIPLLRGFWLDQG